MAREDILKALTVEAKPFTLPNGVTVRIRELTVRERLTWRKEAMDPEGNLKDDWALQVLARCVLLPDEEAPLWASPSEVDGADGLIAALIEKALEVNGLKQGAVKEAAENFTGTET